MTMRSIMVGVILLMCGVSCPAAENPVFAQLSTAGIESGGTSVALAPPVLADGLSADQQRQALEKIADANHPLEGLLRKSVVSPFVLNIADVPNSSLRRVDLYFVIYADLSKISDDAFLRQELNTDTKDDTSATAPALAALTNEQLASRGLTNVAADERYFAGNFVLFDRVRITGVLHAQKTTTPDSVLVAMRMDPRFDSDAEQPNSWQSLRRDDAGKLQIGAAQRYHAAGGYLKATRLVEPAGALFLEQHIVFDEPSGWFDGANLLRSKLPIVCQDGVRKTRRRIGQ
jgi:hypothetical protein